MTTIREIEDAVRELSPEDLQKFRQWFLEYHAALWDRQIEDDAASGRLDALMEEARAEYRAGLTRSL
jgi:hypothetical protein